MNFEYITRGLPKEIFYKPTLLQHKGMKGFAINLCTIFFYHTPTGISTMQICWFGNGTNKEYSEANYIMPESKREFIDKLLYHCGEAVIKNNPELKKHAPLIHGNS